MQIRGNVESGWSRENVEKKIDGARWKGKKSESSKEKI